jgi:hypothetical protein
MHKSFCIIGKFIVDNLEKRASKSFLAIEKTTWVFGIKKKGMEKIQLKDLV